MITFQDWLKWVFTKKRFDRFKIYKTDFLILKNCKDEDYTILGKLHYGANDFHQEVKELITRCN